MVRGSGGPLVRDTALGSSDADCCCSDAFVWSEPASRNSASTSSSCNKASASLSFPRVGRLITPRVRWRVPRGRIALSGILVVRVECWLGMEDGFSASLSSSCSDSLASPSWGETEGGWGLRARLLNFDREELNWGRDVGVMRGRQRKWVGGAFLGGMFEYFVLEE